MTPFIVFVLILAAGGYYWKRWGDKTSSTTAAPAPDLTPPDKGAQPPPNGKPDITDRIGNHT